MEKEAVLTVSDLSLYYSKKKALNTINMTFYKNEITALIGPSGCGKSTLLRSINRMNDLIPTVTITGAIDYKGKNIYEVLEMTVEEALEFFENIPKITKKLQTLYDVGLGYMKIGQPATTLSGGEAQRIKLAKELSRTSTGKTLYILDEPTTGLHFADIKRLLEVLARLTDSGNSVVVIEHNLDVIKTADHIIDLGPEGGDGGGQVIATGTPEEVAESGTYTGEFLERMLNENITPYAKELVEDLGK